MCLCLTGNPAVAAADGETGTQAAPEGPVFVRLAPINIPVIEGNRVSAQVGVALSLELVEGKTAADLEPLRRQLFDAYINDLYAIFQQRIDPVHPVDANLIKDRLRLTTERLLGPGLVKDVLIVQLFRRPFG
jgi:hypothetical protein